jgi:hypothetical protein
MKVFLSYCREHRAVTRQLARKLEAKGFTVWWDTKLLAGDEFGSEIDKHLDAAKAVVVIWTPISIKRHWVKSEAGHANRQHKLVNTHTADLKPIQIPKPFDIQHSVRVTDFEAIVASLERLRLPRSARALQRWKFIKLNPTPLQVRNFITEFGTTRFGAPARKLLSSLERVAWKRLSKGFSAAGLRQYLEDFPDGAHAALAGEQRLALRTKRPAKQRASAKSETERTVRAPEPPADPERDRIKRLQLRWKAPNAKLP